uniref:Uncharacterized protein n=1 Tax=Ixodes ricinus TaxID=34613 RepID=A0A0K8RI75_IXORI
MRGRCSAGPEGAGVPHHSIGNWPKTFCQNCGILGTWTSLTTNLDRKQHQGPGDFLWRRIKVKEKETKGNKTTKRNFQMIVITHDEEFLRLLSQRISVAEYFYKVEKTDMGYSKLQKARLGTIM